MHNSLSVRYFILTAGKTFAVVDRLIRESQPIILASDLRFWIWDFRLKSCVRTPTSLSLRGSGYC